MGYNPDPDHDFGPRLSEVPQGWHFVRLGKVKPGDKFWHYLSGTWKEIYGRVPVRVGDEISTVPKYVYIIRKKKEK